MVGRDGPLPNQFEQWQHFPDSFGLSWLMSTKQNPAESRRCGCVELKTALLDHLQEVAVVADDDAPFVSSKSLNRLVRSFLDVMAVRPDDVRTG